MATAADCSATLLLLILLVAAPFVSRSFDEPSFPVREVLASVHSADSPTLFFNSPDSSERHHHRAYRSNPREAARMMMRMRMRMRSSAHLTLADLDRDNARVKWLDERLESALKTPRKAAPHLQSHANEKATETVKEEGHRL